MMNYNFPLIQHIKDVLPYIDETMFVVADKGDYIVISYLFSSPDVFPDIDGSELAAMRREFRGLIFDKQGNIARRPFQKFFNIGERQDTQINNIDVSKPHVIFEKLDGSMIAPFIINGNLKWGTKMGETDVSKQAEEFVNNNKDIDYIGFAESWIEGGYTPIFEWVSRKQRIVLDYPEDKLYLTAMRCMRSGKYLDVTTVMMSTMDEHLNIPTCPILKQSSLSQEFVNDAKVIEDGEGYVVRFNDGHMVKIKSDYYCALHKVKSDLDHERGVVRLIIDEKLDDLKPILMKDDLSELERYEKEFGNSMRLTAGHIQCVLGIIEGERMTRKHFAISYSIAANLCQVKKHIIFKLFDKGINVDYSDIIKELENVILKNCHRKGKFVEFRKTEFFDNIKPWRGVHINE